MRGAASAEEPGEVCGPGLFSLGLFAEATPAEDRAVHAPLPPLEPEEARAEAAGRGARRRARRAVVSPLPFRGRASRERAAGDDARDLAWTSTLLAALADGRGGQGGLAIAPEPRHLRRWVRTRRPGRLALFVVDASGSMGEGLVAVARRLALGLLERAYVQRERVALVAFRERSAELVLPPTDRPERVHTALGGLTFGGTTPLGAALALARAVVERPGRRREAEEVLVVISDGRGNVGRSPGREAVLAEIGAEARALAARPTLRAVLLDATEEGDDDRPARRLAEQLGARRIALWTLRAAAVSGSAGPDGSPTPLSDAEIRRIFGPAGP